MSNRLLGVWSGQVDKNGRDILRLGWVWLRIPGLDGTEVGSHQCVEWDMDVRRRIRWRSTNLHLRHHFLCLYLVWVVAVATANSCIPLSDKCEEDRACEEDIIGSVRKSLLG